MALKTRKKQVEAPVIHRPRKARFQALPRVEIKWTERELESLAEFASAAEASPPTEALVRALRG